MDVTEECALDQALEQFGGREQSNVEVVTQIMEFSRHGALAQAFVMDAFVKHSRAVAGADPSVFAGMDGGFVAPAAWQSVAREIAETLGQHFNKS